ncbi:IMPACT family protein [Polaribacter marinivivus]|mgnify:CR=1 FL=1|uniref:IMPACT family protein n=1 Tax=Polaribacter marinivivus TaxID=1524260 RepID=A0ABV8RA18_9FLAO
MIIDIFKTIKSASEETLFKDKNSKFYGFAFPVNNEDEVKNELEKVKKIHPNAGHHCYAYQIGVEDIIYRANDDGEPNNSAGMPIYGQIQSFDITNVLIVVVRYFGGTKLGVSGLINAYRSSAKITIESSEIIEKTVEVYFKIIFEYDMMSKVLRILKEKNIEIIQQKLELNCEYIITVRKKESKSILEFFKNLYKVEIKALES